MSVFSGARYHVFVPLAMSVPLVLSIPLHIDARSTGVVPVLGAMSDIGAKTCVRVTCVRVTCVRVTCRAGNARLGQTNSFVDHSIVAVILHTGM
jgi:hypothetical protein